MSRESSLRETSEARGQVPEVAPIKARPNFTRIDAAAIIELLPVCVEGIDLRGFVTYRNPAAWVAWSRAESSDPSMPWLLRWSAESRPRLQEAMLHAQAGSRSRVLADRPLAGHIEQYEVTLRAQMRSRVCHGLLAISRRLKPTGSRRTADCPDGEI